MLQVRLVRVMRMKCALHRALFYSACVCVLACMNACSNTGTSATAAASATTVPPAVVPPAAPAQSVATTMQSTAAGAAALSNVQRLVRLDFQCVDMTTVLLWLAEFTGEPIIADPGVSGPVTIVNPQPTSPDQARQIIFSVLESKGFTAVRQMLQLPDGSHVSGIKIMPKADAAHKPTPPVRPPLRPDATSTKER